MLYKKALDTMLFVQEGDYFVGKESRLYKVNEVGARIYNLCNGKESLDSIIKKIAHKFNVTENGIYSDVEQYLKYLVELGIVAEIIE